MVGGPAPIPEEIKRLRGYPSHRAKRKVIRPDPLYRKGAFPAPPEYMTPVAREEWLRISQEVYRLGLLTSADLSAFVAYCLAYEMWLKANRDMRDDKGEIQLTKIADKTGYEYLNPAVAAYRKAAADMVKYAECFGLTPSSRSRIAVFEEKANDEFEELLSN